MKTIPPVILSVVLLASGIVLAHAQDYDRDRYDGHNSPIHGQGHRSGRAILARFHEFDDRIRDGIRSGELTHEESDNIRRKEGQYRAKFDDFMARNHGYLTDNEESSLNRSLDDLSDEIRRHKHDDKVR